MIKDSTPTRFKVELEMNKRVFIQVYFATHLTDLFNQIADEFPKAIIENVEIQINPENKNELIMKT
jgi:hypothetical protein